MKKNYNQPKVDFLTLVVKNNVCQTFGVESASPAGGTGIIIGGSGQVISD